MNELINCFFSCSLSHFYHYSIDYLIHLRIKQKKTSYLTQIENERPHFTLICIKNHFHVQFLFKIYQVTILISGRFISFNLFLLLLYSNIWLPMFNIKIIYLRWKTNYINSKQMKILNVSNCQLTLEQQRCIFSLYYNIYILSKCFLLYGYYMSCVLY